MVKNNSPGEPTPRAVEALEQYLKDTLPQIGVTRITLDDTHTIHLGIIENIKRMEQARGGFTHEWVTLKSKGRVVIPENLRNAIGAVEGTRFDAHLFPTPEKPRGIALIKER